MPVIRRSRQEDLKFEAALSNLVQDSLGYIVRSCLMKQNKINNNKI